MDMQRLALEDIHSFSESVYTGFGRRGGEGDADTAIIYDLPCGRRDNVPIITVLFRDRRLGGWFTKTFAIRTPMGNVTEIGRRLGIKTLDKRIIQKEPKGVAITDYLHALAKGFAGKLTRGQYRDITPYAARRSLALTG